MMKDTAGPFVLWQFYGTEGWQPTSFKTLREALEAHRYQSDFVITKAVEYQVVECEPQHS